MGWTRPAPPLRDHTKQPNDGSTGRILGAYLSVRARVAAWNPLPQGTLRIGAGFIIAGVTAYGFLVISARAVGPERFVPLSVLWSIVIVGGPGFFLPLEQQLGREIALRRARGEGTANVVRGTGGLGVVMAGMLVLTALITMGLSLDHLFEREMLLLVGLLVALIGYALSYLLRGVLAGNGHFGSYSLLIGSEGALRVAGAIVLAVIGVDAAGPFGLVIGLAPLLALPVALRGDVGLTEPGPEAPRTEAWQALRLLLAGSVLAQVLLNAPPIAVKLLSSEQTDAAAGRLLAGLVIARVPVFLFQAVQAAFLPRLAALAGGRRIEEFQHGFIRLLKLVAIIGVTAIAGALSIGPLILRLFFGDAFELGRSDLGYLAAGSAVFVVALTYCQALIAIGAYAPVAMGWLLGVVFFVVVTILGSDLFVRVELGFIAGSLASAATMAGAYAREFRVLKAAY